MSQDTRLGVNPLSWVEPGAANGIVPIPTPAVDAARPEDDIPAEEAVKAKTPDAKSLLFSPVRPGGEEERAKGKVKFKQDLPPSRLIAMLRELADSLESGAVRLADGTDVEAGSIVLPAPQTAHFEMKAGRKKNKARFSLEISW